MPHFFDHVSGIRSWGKINVTFNNDGSVWAHYILDGINFSPADGNSYVSAQLAHERLFTRLAGLPCSEYSLHGLKTHIPLSETLSKIRDGLPADFTLEKYPIVARNIQALIERKKRGELKEFDRVYWLAARIPVGDTLTSSLLERLFVRRPDHLSDLDPTDFVDESNDILNAIPWEFHARPAGPSELRWAFDRMRYRGLHTSPLPTYVDPKEAANVPSPMGFPQIAVNKFADVEPRVADFVEKYLDEDEEVRKNGTSTYRNNYRMLRYARTLSVANPAQSSDALPDGPTSFQTSVIITGYPSLPTRNQMSFTALVDQYIGVDADFTLRFSYDSSLLNKDSIRKFRNEFAYLARTDSEDDLDMAEYESDAAQAALFHSTRNRERAQVPLKVCAIFTFAHNDRYELAEAVSRIIDVLEGNGYSAEAIAGSQYTLLKQSLPGVAHAKITKCYSEATTVEDFAPCFPVRSTRTGDRKGVPVMVNRENSFGQLIYYDPISAPDKGNASMLLLGAQGSGKSHFNKYCLGWFAGMHCAAHVFDPSPTAEYATYLTALRDRDPAVTITSLNFGNPAFSLDPLKVYDDADAALNQFIRVYFPLLTLEMGSPVVGTLTQMLKPSSRDAYSINSVRDMIHRIKMRFRDNSADPIDQEMMRIAHTLDFVSEYPAGRALVDPVGVSLPPLRAETNVLLYQTAVLKVRKAGQKMEVESAIGSAIYLAAAEFTSWAFMHHMRDMPCFTFGDEMSFLSGSPETLERLVKEPTRQGRKYRKALFAGTQDAGDLDENYSQISKVVAFRQERQDTAVAALRYAGLPDTPAMVTKMITDTSPRSDVVDGVVPGRYGEGWFVDGIHFPVRMQTLPEMVSDYARASDTRASAMAARMAQDEG